MTELKTLKDIRKEYEKYGGGEFDWVLKQEAIKYVKEIESRVGEYGEHTKKAKDMMYWFRKFFNITEDDLI